MFGFLKKRTEAEPLAATHSEPSTMAIHKRIRRIEIITRRAVNDVFAGQYHSNFKGRGMEFAEVREYISGDNVRDIDWNVTARLGAPYVKKFKEERELTVFLIIDVSASFDFGTRSRTKAEAAAEIAALLAFSAIQNNDKVGAIFFSDIVEKFIPPQKGRQHVLRVIQDILTFHPARRGTSLRSALEYFIRSQKKRTICFVVSDFYSENFEQALALAARKHDIVAFPLQDPMEEKFPNVGRLIIEDAETGRLMIVDSSSERFRTAFQKRTERRGRDLETVFSKYEIDHCDIQTNQDPIHTLIRFFKNRSRRVRM